MSAPILVTGATGFIGQHVVRRLLGDGAPVRVLVRRPGLLPAGIASRADVRQGDVCDAEAVDRAVAGCGTVLHLAACARAWCRDPEVFRRVNVDAVASLIDSVRRHGVERLVHVSTVLTLPQLRRGRALTPYEVTKLDGERIVEGSGIAAIVHPTRVYGPGPLNDANGVTRVLALYLAGRFRFRLDDGDVQANYVHAADVAAGILLAATRGEPGGHYVLGGENASMRELLDRVGRIAGASRRVMRLPPALAMAVGAAAEGWGRLGGAVPITRAWVRLFLEDQRVDPGAGPPGYAPRPLDTGLAETVAWLREQERRAA